MRLNPEVRSYYELGLEPERLEEAQFQLEAVRTKEIILRYAAGSPLRVLDAGGGAGYYSFWFARLGHEVYLVDPVSQHIDKARETAKRTKSTIKSISEGEARNLEFEDDVDQLSEIIDKMHE